MALGGAVVDHVEQAEPCAGIEGVEGIEGPGYIEGIEGPGYIGVVEGPCYALPAFPHTCGWYPALALR